MARELPKIKYKGKLYYVDFRLGELRSVRGMKIIRFTELKEDKYSDFKKSLRRLRSYHWSYGYIRGVDD